MAEEDPDNHPAGVVGGLGALSPFFYNKKRICTRLCLFMKLGGFAFYTAGAITCVNRNDAPFIAYCSMLVGMFASICNWARYECAFYKIHGTQFNSAHEFNAWKVRQMPNLRHWFDVIERVITCCFFVKAWPLQFPISDSCELSMTFFKIHVIALFAVYLIALVFFVCIYVSFRSFHTAYVYANAQANTVHDATTPPMESFYFKDDQTECCICLDKTAEMWAMTRCAHSFHRKCLSNWTQTTATCPVCRTRLDQNQN
jgi:hypothetical protein